MNDAVHNSADSDGIFEPFDIARAPWEEFTKGNRFGMQFQVLSEFGGGSQITVSNEILLPGKQSNQPHYHMLEEEHVFILEGSLTLRLGEKNFEMRAGHYVCFPAAQKVPHSLFNHTESPCRYLVFGNPQPHDVVVFPETDRVRVKVMDESYRKGTTMAYWDGVDVG